MNKKTISVLITDLDNTLYDWVEVWYQSFRAMLDRVVEASGVPEEILLSEIKAVHQKHGTSEYAFLLEELPSLQAKHPVLDIPGIYSEAIHSYRRARKEHLKLFPRVEETLRTIKARGCTIVAYTESMAFYTNYSPSGEDREWSIMVIPADGSGPTKGVALTQLVVATNVTKDIEVGPAWLPWDRVMIFARNLKAEWNPIYLVDAETREERRLETGTRMNHDLTCSSSGWLAFRAQVASWDDIFVAPLPRTP